MAFRRDTHDGEVPEIVFQVLLPMALRLCPNIEVVILERLGETVRSQQDINLLQQDFKRMRSIVVEHREKEQLHRGDDEGIVVKKKEEGGGRKEEGVPVGEHLYEDDELAEYQASLLTLLGMSS